MVPQITPAGGKLVDLLNKTFGGTYDSSWVRAEGYLLPAMYAKFSDAIENFEVHDDDVWVCSFPKTGTTWTQEMVWCITNNMKSEGAKVPLTDRFPFFEISPLTDIAQIIRSDPDFKIPELMLDSVSYTRRLTRPRFIKTHLPFELLPRQIREREKTPKIVYVVRNAKDTCISFYHHCLLVEGFQGSFEDFVELFLGDTLYYAPFWDHALSFWKRTTFGNLLFIKYEDMKLDLPSVIRTVAKFLGKSLTSEEVSSLNEHLSFESMKANPAVNNESLVATLQELTQIKREGAFMRTGTTEQWKSDMTPETTRRFDERNYESLKGTGLSI